MEFKYIHTVAVIGAGTMGQGIVISCALSGYETFLHGLTVNFTARAQRRERLNQYYSAVLLAIINLTFVSPRLCGEK